MDALWASEPPLDAPFTPAIAAARGMSRACLERHLREGTVVRIIRGVYAPIDLIDCLDLRARALALVVPPGAAVVDRTAAWLYGVPVPAHSGEHLDVLGRGRGRRHFGASRPLQPGDLCRVDELLTTTPLRTAADLGRLLGDDDALALLDAFLRAGLPLTALLAELPRHGRLRGCSQLRELAVLADGRAIGAAESALRLRWLRADLPTPLVGAEIAGVRLALADPHHRVAAHTVALTGEQRSAVGDWRVVVVSEQRLRRGDPALLQEHLRREYHRHLLEQWSA